MVAFGVLTDVKGGGGGGELVDVGGGGREDFVNTADVPSSAGRVPLTTGEVSAKLRGFLKLDDGVDTMVVGSNTGGVVVRVVDV